MSKSELPLGTWGGLQLKLLSQLPLAPPTHLTLAMADTPHVFGDRV
jgi:hypothetical protein